MNLFRLLDHPNVLSFCGMSYEIDDNSEFFYILSPLASSDLTNFMKKNELDTRMITWICLSIAKGMEFIHSFNIVHRDLKPDNIFIYEGENSKEPLIRIGDLGIAVTVSDTSIGHTVSCGTNGYMAPEMLEAQEIVATGALMKIDLYSFGSLLYEIISGERPFNKLNPMAIAAKMVDAKQKDIMPLEIPSCHPTLKKLLKSCWSWYPSKRPDFSSVVHQLENLYSLLNK